MPQTSGWQEKGTELLLKWVERTRVILGVKHWMPPVGPQLFKIMLKLSFCWFISVADQTDPCLCILICLQYCLHWLQDVLASVSGRIPSKVEDKIKGYLAQYSSNITSILTKFPSQQVRQCIPNFTKLRKRKYWKLVAWHSSCEKL